MFHEFYKSSIGCLKILASESEVLGVKFIEETEESNSNEITQLVRKQLDEYFHRKRIAFELPLANLGTDFQWHVWEEVSAIPFGKTASYLDIANKLGDRNLTRAVGTANGANPFLMVVPCHRIIGSNGSLTGYAGGLHQKRALLDFENPNRLAQQELF